MWDVIVENLLKMGWVGAGVIVLVIGSTFVIGIDKVTAAIKSLFGRFFPPPSATHISKIGREGNPRFDFHFDFPSTWDRVDPQNGDGNKYVHPLDSRIYYSCWGGYNVFEKGPIAYEKKWQAEKEGYTLIDERYSGRHLVTYETVEGKVIKSSRQIEGWRYVYQHQEKGIMMKFIKLLVPYGERTIEALCAAPVEVFPAYEEFFLRLISGIVVNNSSGLRHQ